jgi:hypothetical protein
LPPFFWPTAEPFVDRRFANHCADFAPGGKGNAVVGENRGYCRPVGQLAAPTAYCGSAGETVEADKLVFSRVGDMAF